MSIPIKTITWLLLLHSFAYGQMNQYDYKRELKGVSEQYHNVILPNDVFGKVSQNLSDIRIFGITANNDTVESPYLIRQSKERVSHKTIAFKMLNVAHNDKGYFFTFEVPTKESINQINLDFKQQNFDWLLKIEGSHNQEEWFTVVEDYRILSIKNESTDFHFTNINLTNTKYHFFRLRIDSKEKPELTIASIGEYKTVKGQYSTYPIKKTDIKENKQSKQTEIKIELNRAVPVSRVNIAVADTFDYYRPISIKYLTDSFKTDRGWMYNYNTLTSGTLNSINEKEFNFNSSTLQKIKIIIHNQDNQALNFDSIYVMGAEYKLIARFTETATYFLTYGNNSVGKPNYDIKKFEDKIADNVMALDFGKEQSIEKSIHSKSEPLFENKNWLWAVMAVIILLLGWFSVQMMRNK